MFSVAVPCSASTDDGRYMLGALASKLRIWEDTSRSMVAPKAGKRMLRTHLLGMAGTAALLVGGGGSAAAAAAADETAPAANAATTLNELIVTAQKREENIQDVPMSVTAATGEDLLKFGVKDTQGLQSVVVGFQAATYGGLRPVFTIRGIGFQAPGIAVSPTVSLYVDQAPQSVSSMAQGNTLDLQRVEVLKGPQGTLFGANATAGAVNFVANTPTDHFTAGFDASYGRFNDVDLRGFVSGPISDTLSARLALQTNQAGDWQYDYVNATHHAGQKDFLNGRLSLLWKPTPEFRANLTLSGFIDKSDTQVRQFVRVDPLSPTPLRPELVNFPLPPHNDARAASWTSCVPTSALSNLRDVACSSLAKDNKFFQATLRFDYDLTDDVTLTSLSTGETIHQFLPVGGVTPYYNLDTVRNGDLYTYYSELRLAGTFGGRGTWIVGANYERDGSTDRAFSFFPDSSFSQGGTFFRIQSVSFDHVDRYAAFANAEYPILPTLTAQAGVRYTENKEKSNSCNLDGGDGSYSRVVVGFQGLLGANPVIVPGVGGCGTINDVPSSPGGKATFQAGFAKADLNENNVAWRVGLNWKPTSDQLYYANVSQGYKAGSFGTSGGAALASQYFPVTQEKLIAYEAGAKTNLLGNTLQLNGAVFYYDYSDKQSPGTADTLFGPLPRLLNIPKSKVTGFEVSAIWRPVSGFTISPSLSQSNSKITSHSPTTNAPGAIKDVHGVPIDVYGERFSFSAEWQGRLDAEYEWTVLGDATAYVGATVNYISSQHDGYGKNPIDFIPSYTLVDLRAGLEKDAWRFEVWGKNVTDHYYYSQIDDFDILSRYTGLPATYGITVSYRYH